jgi:hypothetical protein
MRLSAGLMALGSIHLKKYGHAALILASLGFQLPLSMAQHGIRVDSFKAEVRTFYTIENGLPSDDVRQVAVFQGSVYADTAKGPVKFESGKWQKTSGFPGIKKAVLPDGARNPRSGNRSWALRDVRGVVYDSMGRLWFASPQGVGCLENGEWKLFTPAEGLPCNDFTCMAAGEQGVVWFGTKKGAIRFDGRAWEYRQGLRWLPEDEIRSIAVEPNGNAWFATSKGVGLIERRPTTLSEKARFFEDEIDKRHRRTPYGYVLGVSLKRPGDKSAWTQHDSDNDGLWTSMYGAGQCFACAATGSETAKKRAQAAFEALRFLRTVTQGGSNPAPPGFIARTVLPATDPNPNTTHYTRERDERERATRDGLWKVLVPRWPTSADGQWYWKTDTSSDELDGHFFFYGLYYDLVASTEEEKERVREHVAAIADHLLGHNFQLVDHDGNPTRWGVFNPEALNHSINWWQERGTNSLSILAYLKVAEHVTGQARYGEAAKKLIENHAYAANALIPKTNAGPGSGNQSDDEMHFMNYYNLIRYETDPDLRQKYLLAFRNHWIMERPELNPLFNFMYASMAKGESVQDAFGREDLSPQGDWLEESVDSLRRYPLDRVNWRLTNSHRMDILPLPDYARERGAKGLGYRNNGKVLPIDERFVDQWNHDPWQLDQGGDGQELADGSSFLLPYYMGLYHKFIVER